MPTLDRLDQVLDAAFRSALVRRVAWSALRRGVAADRLGAAFARDLIRVGAVVRPGK